MVVIRPADANEVAEAWRLRDAVEHDKPVALALSRQALPTIDRSKYAAASGRRARRLRAGRSARARREVILIGDRQRGVARASGAYEALAGEGIRGRVVSMPSWDLFEEQDEDYRESVLPPAITARVAVEQGASDRLGPLMRARPAR